MRAGASLSLAADSIGIPNKTALGWRYLGERACDCPIEACLDPHHGPPGDGLSYADFAEQVQRAKGYAGLRAMASVSTRFQSDPRYAERWLAKQYARDFGLRPGAEVDIATEPDRAPFVIQFIESNRPQEEIDEIGRAVARDP